MDKIKSVIILEILGRPENYVKDSLNVILEKLKSEQGIKITDTKTAEPKKIENKDIFSSFAEVEFEADNLAVLINLMFRYMPSHIEIISPERIDMRNADLNSILNDLMLKLHRYDELAKILSIEKNILVKQIVQLKQQSGIKPEETHKQEKPKRKAKSKKKKAG